MPLPRPSTSMRARNWNGANKRTERFGAGAQPWTRPQVFQNFGTLVTFGLRTQF